MKKEFCTLEILHFNTVQDTCYFTGFGFENKEVVFSNNWHEKKYSVGKVVTGKVARMTNFGAFIELDTGVDALLHVSQIAREHIEKPSDVLNIGDEITAMVVDFKEESKKISLSIKQLLIAEEKNKEDAEEVSE